MDAHPDSELIVDHFPAAWRSMRVACVTESYPPEVNGVSLSVARMVDGLHRRNHDVQLVRPRQAAADAAGSGPRFHEVLMRGLPIPRYPHLRMGVPSKRQLVQLIRERLNKPLDSLEKLNTVDLQSILGSVAKD